MNGEHGEEEDAIGTNEEEENHGMDEDTSNGTLQRWAIILATKNTMLCSFFLQYFNFPHPQERLQQ